MSTRTRRSLALTWSALFVLSLLLQYFAFAVAAPVLAVHDEGLFELDGNAVNQPAPGDDWDQVRAGTSGAINTEFITDAIDSSPAEHLFTGGGSKDEQPISNWAWKTGAGVQDKNDIEHAFAAAYVDPDNGDLIAYFGLDRFAVSGDAFVGFWFLKSGISENANHTFDGAHVNGDILVQVNFTNGGAIQDFLVSTWQNGGLVEIKSGVECTPALVNDDACGKVNQVEIDSPWPYTPKSGTANKIPAGGFFEGGLNLSALKLDTGCFATFLAETRSSQSLTSTLSDYAFGGFSFCVTPDIATQVMQGTTSLGVNGDITIGESVTDKATLTGSKGTVEGTIVFSACFDATAVPDCTTGGTKVGATKTLSGGIATSDALTPDAVGFYCFRADYTPAAGSKYLAVSHTNTTTECFQVHKKQPTIVTTANQTVSIGQSISDSATLSGATSDATGTITFNAYGPGAGCTGDPVFTTTATVSDNGTYGPVSFTPTTAGSYHWIASYSGDAKNESSTGACLDGGENDTVNKANPTVVTVASVDVTVGGNIWDVATLAGGSAPTGSITFNLYGPDDTDCSGAIAFTSTRTVTGNGAYTSDTFTTSEAGDYNWIANYSGDANNNATSNDCNEANEDVVVNPASPTIATVATEGGVPGDPISDTATVSGGFEPTGTVTFRLWGPGNPTCTGTPIFTSTVTLAVNGTATSASFAPALAGVFNWIASYSGDQNNNAVTGLCGDANETTTINTFSPAITTVLTSGTNSGASISVVFGASVTDQATLTGAGATAGGTVTYIVFSDNTCQTVFADAGTVNVTNGAVPASNPVTFPVAGTYYWQAHYSGDANNTPATSACTDEILTVLTPRIHAVKLVATNDDDFAPSNTAQPGDTVTFQITVSNSGNVAATNVPVSDDISALLSHATYNNDCSDSCSLTGDVLSWTISSIPVGGSEVLTYSITLDATFPNGTTTLPNVVVVTGPGSNCLEESGSADCDTTTVVSSSALEIEKSVAGNTGGTDPILGVPLAKIGDALTYTLAYTGVGPIHNAIITDVLPTGLDYVVGSAAGDASFTFVSYDSATRTLTWTAASLPDPASGSVSYDVKVLAAAAEEVQPLVNTATIDSDETERDTDTASVAVLPPPLELTPPPTSTLSPASGSSNPGFSLMLVLLGLAGLALGVGFITPVPERVRRRDDLG